MSSNITRIANALADGVKQAATYSGRAAATANGTSFASQAAQGAFNQASANIANGLGTDRLLAQYGFNSAQAASANDFTKAMWDASATYNTEAWERAAQWNEAMMERQMQFNHNEAELNRNWQQKMAETNYQRAVTDMKAAGINPILASGGVSVGSGSGSTASVGGSAMSQSSMSPVSGAMASGGLLNGISASEGNFSGQMEYMAGILGLFSAGISGLASALKVMDEKTVINILGNYAEPKTWFEVDKDSIGQKAFDALGIPYSERNSYHEGSSGTIQGRSHSFDRGTNPKTR